MCLVVAVFGYGCVFVCLKWYEKLILKFLKILLDIYKS